MQKKCNFYKKNELPPCISLKTNKYKNLQEFLFNNNSTEKNLSFIQEINCIKVLNGGEFGIDIKNEECINCMSCLFSCPRNQIQLHNDLSLKAKCSSFIDDYPNKITTETLDRLFKGTFISFPEINLAKSHKKPNSFNDFTSYNETKNISIWGANVINYLISGNMTRVATEVSLNLQSRDRAGRIDIAALSDSKIFLAEAKTSFSSMVSEGRYIAQSLAYKEEADRIRNIQDNKKTIYNFLLVGGNESDLLPPNHKNCTSNTGNQSEDFYKKLEKYKLKFISANALLSLGLLKIFKGDKYSLDNIADMLFNDDNLGLLSSGAILKRDKGYKVNSLFIN
jgi:NAD-dependent dihydropyrimidine dehydrogenase PreA subunit